MAKLIIFDESVRGVDLPERPVVIGRSLKADIPIRDRLLSRKHCTLIGDGTDYRLLDLNSANGSFVNGVRVSKADLECDDVIEIGNTVMVLLTSDTWERGEGLTRLRNPVKAQELIQRLGRHTRRIPGEGGNSDHPSVESLGGTGSGGAPLTGDDSVPWSREVIRDLKLTPDLLEGFLTNKIASLLVQRSPELRECLSDALERVLSVESLDGDIETFRCVVRDAIRASLAEAGLAERGESSLETGVPEPTPHEEPGLIPDGAPDDESSSVSKEGPLER